MTRQRSLVLFTCFLLVGSLACRKTSDSDNQLAVQLEAAPQGYRVGNQTIALKISDTRGNPISGAQVSLEGNMSHAGMAPTFGKATEVATGSYRGNLEFSMAGDWIITVSAHLSDGRQIEKHFEIKEVRPN